MEKQSRGVIVPTPDELSQINNNLACTERGCMSLFKSQSNLRMHVIKHHKREPDLGVKRRDSQFACPVKSCKYSLNSLKYFSKLKFLKQHYLKCHSPKSFACTRCSKAFSTKAYLNGHMKSCGKKFICSCGWEYTSRETLMTHCKRKKHSPAGEVQMQSEGSNEGSEIENGKVEENTLLQVCISPQSKSPRKPTSELTVFPTHYVAAIALSELSTTFIIPKNCHIGVQTVETKQKKIRNADSKKRKNTQETQTAECKKIKISTETQTSYHLKHSSGCRKLSENRKRSTETQTKDSTPFLSGLNTESLDDGMFNESSLSNSSINNDETLKASSQSEMDEDTVWGNTSYSKHKFPTTVNNKAFNLNAELKLQPSTARFTNLDKLCNNETQTEVENIFQSEPEGTSSTETQTTNDLLEDFYNNMCTQTCSDTGDLFDFNFVDIETQTAWPDL